MRNEASVKRKLSFAISVLCLLIMVCSVGAAKFDSDGVYSDFSVKTNYREVVFDHEMCLVDNNLYFPIRNVAETLGSAVYYSHVDKNILILTRDGDVIIHHILSNIFSVNGEIKEFPQCSIVDSNGVTMFTSHMINDLFATNIYTSDQTQKTVIEREITFNDSHKAVANVLKCCVYDSFNPEKFNRYLKYYTMDLNRDINNVISDVNLDLDKQNYADASPIENPYEPLVLVNKLHMLPPNFSPPKLVDVDKKYHFNDKKEYKLEQNAYNQYIKMYDTARENGANIIIVSAYRTEDYQRGLYNNKLNSSGKNMADKYSARPGHSEHQTGLAVDINATSGLFQYTKEYKWMKDNAHLFGFIERYKMGKEFITGYAFEPWHYRYVGVDVAKIIYEFNISFEEYYARYINKSNYKLNKDFSWQNIM